MGNVCCIRRPPKRKITLLLVGLDNAGKTVAAKNLAGEIIDDDNVMPTIGFSIVHLTYKRHSVDIFDLGGSSNIRGIWDKYFVYAHGIIYVVDSSDFVRLQETKDVLHDLVSHEKISGKPLILLANKQDNEDALDEIDLIEKLQLEELVNSKQCPTLVESCSATEKTSKSKLDPGIQKAYHWLLNYIIRDYSNLNRRVEDDVKLQEEKENEFRLETMKRIKLRQENESNADDVIELYSDYNKKLNGIVRSPVRNVATINKEEMNSDDSPQKVHIANIEQRPKSAIQIVREQLQLDQTKQRSPMKLKSSKKTEPVNLYGMKLPHSANVNYRREAFVQSRNLKSAGDSVFIVSNMSNTINVPTDCGDVTYQRELFQINNFEQRTKLPPLQYQKEMNSGVSEQKRNEENALSIIEID